MILNIGDVVERHLQKGDVVLLNRQPTLHRGGMLAMEVIPMPGKSFRLNLAITPSFNADFDFQLKMSKTGGLKIVLPPSEEFIYYFQIKMNLKINVSIVTYGYTHVMSLLIKR